MAILQTDILFHSAIKAALADLRKNIFLLEDAFSGLTEDPLLKDAYGEKEVQNFKGFLAKKIEVYTEHRIPDQATFPCIVLRIGGGNEDNSKDALGDGYQSEQVNPATLGGVFKTPRVLLGPVTPEAYDPMTGQVTFGADADLDASNVFEGQFVYDEVNKKFYEIKLVIDSANLLLEEGLNPPPNLTGMTIRPSKEAVGHIRRSIWTWETVEMEVHATDSVEVLYLYTILMYSLLRYKKPLWDARNFAVSTITYGPLAKLSPEGDPNLVYARTIKVQGRVEQSVIESTQPLLDGLSLELKIADMRTPAGIEQQVKAQDWDGEGDDF